jgi:very-short-patch-repair endonuclease
MAACLWAGPETAASHRAAAHLWGWNGFESPPIEISTTSRKRPHGLDIVAHRVDRYLLEEITSLAGIPVTSARRTLLDLCGKKHPRRERALDQALRDEIVSLRQIWRLYEKEWARGRRGIAILRDLLVERTPGQAPTQSELEDMLARIIREAGLPGPERQYEVALPSGTKYIDFAYPALLLAIETDGYAWHGDREAFDRDRERDNELQTLGWRVLRFTYTMLRWEPERVVDMIRKHLYPPSGR